MANEIFKCSAILQKGLQVEVKTEKHRYILDEPPELGGTDTGMNPVESLLGALGACKCIVAKAFAQAHKIDLKEIRIEMEGDLDPEGFMGVNKDAKIGFSNIRTNYYIKSDSSEDEISNYVSFIEKNCPVADTIVNTPAMEAKIVIEK